MYENKYVLLCQKTILSRHYVTFIGNEVVDKPKGQTNNLVLDMLVANKEILIHLCIDVVLFLKIHWSIIYPTPYMLIVSYLPFY